MGRTGIEPVTSCVSIHPLEALCFPGKRPLNETQNDEICAHTCPSLSLFLTPLVPVPGVLLATRARPFAGNLAWGTTPPNRWRRYKH